VCVAFNVCALPLLRLHTGRCINICNDNLKRKVLSQKYRARSEARTRDHQIKSLTLYRLSYPGLRVRCMSRNLSRGYPLLE
jgi:hypothetical protein